MKSAVLALCLVMFAGAHAAAASTHADDDGLHVRRTGRVRIAAQPGSVNTVAFQLLNTERTRARALITASLPAGWMLISAADEVSLAPNTPELQLLSFSIPRTARAGTYTVRYSAAYSASAEPVAADSVFVEVGNRAAVDIQFMAAPALVRGGSSFTVSFVLRNQGNTAVRLSLKARVDHRLTARPDFTNVVIEPENAFHLTVRVLTPARIANEVHTRVTLIATDDAQGVVVDASTTLVRVLPTVHEGAHGAGHLPLRLAARVNSSEQITPSLELAGAGPLIAGTDIGLDLIARTATRSNGLSEDRDQLYLRLGNHNVDARFGDHFVTLTPLTELGRPGFGSSINIHAGPVVAGAIAARDRRGDGPDVLGGKIGVRMGSVATVTGNYIARSVDDAQLFSVRTTIAPARFAHGEVEYAANAAGTAADARVVRLGGSLPWASYDIRSVRNSPEFRGSTAGVSSDAAVLRLRPVRRVEIGGAITRSERADVLAGSAPRVETYRAFTSLGRWFGIEAEERNWIRSTGELSSRTHTLRARSSLKAAFVTFQPGLEIMDVANGVTGSSATNMKYTLRTELVVARQRLAIGFGQITSDQPANAWQSAAVTAALQPFSGTRVDIDFQQDRYAGAWKTTLLNAAIDQRFPGDHHIALRARMVAFNDRFVPEQSVVTLEYVLPINISMPRSRAARVDGVVVDANGRPVRDALIRLDDRAVLTGSNGRFSFRDVEPTTHYLQVELSALGQHLTTLTPNPLILDLHEQSARDLRIAVTPGARVRGKIVTRATGSADAQRLAGLLRHTIIELSQGADRQRRAVDAAGTFGFDGLRPGTWHLRIVNELPSDYALAENASTRLDLSAGEERDVVLELLRKDRPIKLLDERTLPTLEQTR